MARLSHWYSRLLEALMLLSCLLLLTMTLLIVPAKPDTSMTEGYGVAAPASGIVIGAELVNPCVPPRSGPMLNNALATALSP